MNDRPAPHALTPSELSRYGRHLILPEVGAEGQERLRAASVAVVGAGGLGSPVALYLAAAGVGRIGLVEFDTVELSNLQRQVLYGTSDVGRPKVERAAARLRDLNPEIEVVEHAVRLAAADAMDVLAPYDVIVDGTDNFPTRYVVNDAAVLLRKPNVYGSIFRFEGQASVFHAGRGPCYRCLFPEPPPPGAVPSCAEGGVLGVLPGVIGTIQATETVKLVLGRGESLLGRLLLFNALEMSFRELRLRADPACAACGEHPTIEAPVDLAAPCAVPGADEPADVPFAVDVASLRARMEGGRAPALLDVRTPAEWRICHLDGARLIPLQELAARHAELDRDAEIVVYCHVGGRSAMAVEFLRRAGFSRVSNLAGGIDAWAAEIDPAMPRY